MKTTLADRLNQIVKEQGIKKSVFARSLGISKNYIYILTGGRATKISPTLAILIEQKYGYPAEWVLTGHSGDPLTKEIADKMRGLDENAMRSVSAYLDTLKGGESE